MKKSFAAIVVIVSAMAAVLPGSAAWAQAGIPSQADIERGLNPAPAIKMRGITPGAIVRFPTDQQTAPVSTNAPSFGTSRQQTTTTQTAPAQRCTPPTPAPGTISLPQITFEFNSSILRPEAKLVLRNLGNALNQGLASQKLFVLEGHTDAVGAADYNQELSRQRAEAAKMFLVTEMRVDADRLQTVGKGSAELANPCSPSAAENRRLVVINASQAG